MIEHENELSHAREWTGQMTGELFDGRPARRWSVYDAATGRLVKEVDMIERPATVEHVPCFETVRELPNR